MTTSGLQHTSRGRSAKKTAGLKLAVARMPDYSGGMRSKSSYVARFCGMGLACLLAGVTHASVSAQSFAPPPSPEESAPAAQPDEPAPSYGETAGSEPASAPPAEVAPPAEQPSYAQEPAYAPSPAPTQAEEPPPPPPPPAEYGAYGGRSERSERRPRYSYDDAGERDPDDYRGSDPGFDYEYSIRLDPFNWLLQGRLGIELEMSVWDYISIELVPILVASTEPPAFNFAGRDDPISQHSNGIGPFSGASLGAGFWLSGTPFRGYVIRAIFTNYGYTYEAGSKALGTWDRVETTERRFVMFFGSHSRFGVFTLAGGIGLGYALNQQERCGLTDNTSDGRIRGRTTDCDGELQIALDPLASSVADLNGSLHPMYLEARFSLGFVF